MANVNTADFVLSPASMPNNFVTGPSAGLAGSSTPTQVGSAGSDGSMLGALGSVLNLIPGIGPILGGIAGTISQGMQNKANRQFEQQEAAAQRAWNEQMMDKQNQFSLDMWNKTNEYNSPIEQVQRLRDAGLNPLYYGLDGTSANAFQSAQAMGYDRASVGNQVNPFSTGLESGMQMRSLQKEIELKNAQIDKLGADTAGVKLDNEWKDKTMEARTLAEKLKNSLTKTQISEIKQSIAESKKRVDKLIAETDNEIERKGLIVAQKLLARAQENEIAELLPYKKLLMDAQTDAQKAAAAASWTHAMYEQGLIDAGYIDALVDEVKSDIRRNNAQADAADVQRALNEWTLSVKNGNTYDVDAIPWSRPTDKIAAYLVNKLFQFTSAASQAIGSGLAGILG